MRIAILGATSMLAADFVVTSLERGSPHRLALFARDPERAHAALTSRGVPATPECHTLASFAEGEWDAIINFVGVGDPARAVAMGADILRITREWDDRVLAYLSTHPGCRYLFLSSGAAFGAGMTDPVERETRACFDINAPAPTSYYGIAKFYAEAMHRAQRDRSIIDIRIFNYLSEFADLGHRFLVNEILAAIRDDRILGVDARDMWRDYLGREDFMALASACLVAPADYNGAVDAYSRAPVSKVAMLELFHDRFGLRYEIAGGGIDATGTKSNYFSRNRSAEVLGYRPRHGSIDTLISVAGCILARS